MSKEGKTLKEAIRLHVLPENEKYEPIFHERKKEMNNKLSHIY